MNQPVDLPVVPFFIVIAPGVDPDSVEVQTEIRKLTWNFGKMDRGELIDLVEEADQFVSPLNKWIEGARGVLKQTIDKPTADNPEVVVAGRRFEAHYVRQTRSALDQEKTKAFLGPRLPEFMKNSEVLVLRIIPITQTPGVAG